MSDCMGVEYEVTERHKDHHFDTMKGVLETPRSIEVAAKTKKARHYIYGLYSEKKIFHFEGINWVVVACQADRFLLREVRLVE